MAAILVVFVEPHFQLHPPAGLSPGAVAGIWGGVKVLLLIWAGWRASLQEESRLWVAACAVLCVFASMWLLVPGVLELYLRYFADQRYVGQPSTSFMSFVLSFVLFAPVALAIGWLGAILRSLVRRHHAT
jgi:membrane protease YdiL (CAAX protease family)